MVLFDSARNHPGVILEGCAAAELTGYNIQHIRRLALTYITPTPILYDAVKATQTTTSGWNTIKQCKVPGQGDRMKI